MEEITLGTNLSLSGTTLNATGGGTPAGSNTNMQFNDSGAFGGANVNYISATERTGFQVATPKSTLHVDNTTGTTIAPPTSLSISYSVDPSIDSPATASATEVGTPVDPSTPTIGFIYIDQPIDNTWYASQTTWSGGFICNGQTLYYSVYGYRNVNGVKVTNPNAFTSITFTDSINDGSTQFYMDIGNWTVPNAYVDGYILVRSDNTGTYTKDIGNVTTYSDTYFTDTDTYTASTLVSSGASWSANIAQYKTINGTNYRTGYISNSSNDANVASAYMVIDVTAYGSLSNDGFIVLLSTGSFYFDIGSSTNYYDYGQSGGSISDYATFASIAFPQFSTSMSAASSVTPDAINYTGSTFFADGSAWTIEIWDYRTHPITGDKYYASSAVSTSYGYDDSSNNGMTFTGYFTASDGSGAVVIVPVVVIVPPDIRPAVAIEVTVPVPSVSILSYRAFLVGTSIEPFQPAP